jgi:hypothetical protein
VPGKGNAFPTALAAVNRSLEQSLFGSPVQSEIEAFYPMRHHLQHRTFLNGLLYVDQGKRESRTLFELPPEGITALRLASANGDGIEWGVFDDRFIDPYTFFWRSMQTLRSVHELVLSSLDWNLYINSFPESDRDAVLNSEEKRRTGLWRAYMWRSEPLYFT